MSPPTTPTSAGPELAHSEPHCPGCGAALAPDQRYCLSCGQRLTDPRVNYKHALHLEPALPPPTPRPTVWEQRGALITLVGVVAVLLALGVGIVIGRGDQAKVVAQKPTVVTVAGAPASTPTTAATATSQTPTGQDVGSISDGWPTDASGWTVELSSFDTSGAQLSAVTTAESAASAKGATAVGVLDGNNHGGTPTGKYVIYSGRYSSQAQAAAAQKKLSKSFPGALVLHVTPKSSSPGTSAPTAGASQAAQVHKLSGSAYVKAAAKLPSTIGTGGAPPPKDNKAPGGGSGGGTCIGC